MVFDCVIANGRVVDPASGIDGLYDIAVSAGRIAGVFRQGVDQTGVVNRDRINDTGKFYSFHNIRAASSRRQHEGMKFFGFSPYKINEFASKTTLPLHLEG